MILVPENFIMNENMTKFTASKHQQFFIINKNSNTDIRIHHFYTLIKSYDNNFNHNLHCRLSVHRA